MGLLPTLFQMDQGFLPFKTTPALYAAHCPGSLLFGMPSEQPYPSVRKARLWLTAQRGSKHRNGPDRGRVYSKFDA